MGFVKEARRSKYYPSDSSEFLRRKWGLFRRLVGKQVTIFSDMIRLAII